VFYNPRRLRRPEERVGLYANAALPPPEPIANADADHGLVRSLRARDEKAFERAMELYFPAMLRLAMSFVRSREEAEEVIQDTWLAVLSGIDRFEGRSSFKTWLFRILVNRARTRAKREARTITFSTAAAQQPGASDSELPTPFEASPPAWGEQAVHLRGPEEHVLAAELTERIKSAIATLPRGQQRVITLRDIEGLSSGEVCQTLSISETNQRVLLHRARSRVRDQLAAYFAF